VLIAVATVFACSGCLLAIRAGVKAVRSVTHADDQAAPPPSTSADAATRPTDTEKAPDSRPAPR
jgi:hypothetical protein